MVHERHPGAIGGVVATIPAPWSVGGTGDFNGDGKADILWSDGTGDSALAHERHVGDLWPSAYSVPRMVDCTDRRLRRRRQQRSVVARHRRRHAVWFMNGTSVSSVANVANVGGTWVVQSVNAE